jgi:hypothetical protein
VTQPIDLSAGGVPIYNESTISGLFVDGDYSMKVLDSLGVQKSYIPHATVPSDVYRPYYAADYLIFPSNDAATNTTNINNAIITISTAGGGKLLFQTGTYLISKVPDDLGLGRDYSIVFKPNVYLCGEGMDNTTIKMDALQNADLIVTDRNSVVENMGLFDMTIDGNEANQADDPQDVPPGAALAALNIYFQNVTGLYFDNVKSINSKNGGFWIHTCQNIFVGTIHATGNAEHNADCVHFTDCAYVVADKIYADTLGDDGVVISSTNEDSHDFSLGEIIAHCDNTDTWGWGVGGGFRVTLGANATEQREIYNINVGNLVAYECGSALSLNFAEIYNVNINVVARDCYRGVTLLAGTDELSGPVFVGEGNIRNCTINVNAYGSGNREQHMAYGVFSAEKDGKIEYCDINMNVYNPIAHSDDGEADGVYGGIARFTGGNNLNLTINGNYDPLVGVDGAKVTPLEAIVLDGVTDSVIRPSVNGGLFGLRLSTESINNTIYLGNMSNNITADVYIQDADSINNTFIGGKINALVDNASGNRWHAVKGGEVYGQHGAPVAGGSGLITFSHGLKGTPVYADVGLLGDVENSVEVNSIGGNNIVVRVYVTATGVNTADAVDVIIIFRANL